MRHHLRPHRVRVAKGVIMAGKFEVYQDKGGDYRFRLKASNGQTIATGQGYTTKAACLNGIESIKKNAPEAEVVEATG